MLNYFVMKRREMLKKSGAALLGVSLMGLPSLAQNVDNKTDKSRKRKKLLVIGAHPDDPESNAGGTIVLMKRAGWDVTCLYMTKGEAGIQSKSHDESAAIRVEEAKSACKVLGAKPVFLTQIDGSSEINKERYAEMKEAIAKENPDIVITHWPIDSHADHRVCASLVYDAWRRLGYPFELYYSESMTGLQSQFFHPTDYVNISEVADIKRESLYCHKSQLPDDWYDDWHGGMEKFRGREISCAAAEGFIHLNRAENDIKF